jgi:TetR/AcrR family transcriptional regulator
MGVAERRKREREVRRELAIDAAMAIYEEEGYHAITMEKIADRAELSRAALYLYFKNKEEILISAIVSHTDYFAGLLEELYNTREGNRGRLLEGLWECFREFYERDPITFIASLYFFQREMIRNLPKELADILQESGSKVVGLQHRVVEYGVQEGVFIPSNPKTLSEVIWSAFLGIVNLEWCKNALSRKGHLDATANLALGILARGILVEPPDSEVSSADKPGAQKTGEIP